VIRISSLPNRDVHDAADVAGDQWPVVAARLVANGSWPSLRTVFFFFSNRLGCLGSLLVSVIFTVVLIAIFTR
jgi:hypothetical protein